MNILAHEQDIWVEKHEAKMNEIVKSLGLVNWEVVYVPDENQEVLGQVIPESRIILIHDLSAKAAMRTVLHEVLELKLQPAFNVHISLLNALIKWANAQAYKMKERSIEDILDVFFAQGSDKLRGILDEISSS